MLPTVDPTRVLGVRMPVLRAYAKRLRHERPELAEGFLGALPHATYDEDMLHGILLNEERDYADAVRLLDAFLPHVDNWAVCDVLAPKAFGSHPEGLPAEAERWMASMHPYAVRFGIGVLMRNYLDEDFDARYLGLVASVRSDDYYVRMMVAWYFATALAKQWETTLPVMEAHVLPPWTHNKAIQKARESFRVSPEHKELLRDLRVRGERGGRAWT